MKDFECRRRRCTEHLSGVLMERSKKTFPLTHILRIWSQANLMFQFCMKKGEIFVLFQVLGDFLFLCQQVCLQPFFGTVLLQHKTLLKMKGLRTGLLLEIHLNSQILEVAFQNLISLVTFWKRLRSHVHLSRAHLATSPVHISR